MGHKRVTSLQTGGSASMSTEGPSTLDPPEQHRDRQWHWARHEGDDKWFAFEVRNGKLWNGPGHMGAEAAYQYGWRYAGPATPPSQSRNDKQT
jgi:hypothetical protein